MPYIGTSPSNGVRRVHTYTATASQTTFTGASSEGVTLSYADTNYLDVFQNGVLLGSADYTSTSGTSVVLAQGASADDLIVIVVYDVFSVADTVSKANGGSFDSAVTMSNNLTVSGAFTSQGIDDNADATAITITSSEDVGIGTTTPTGTGWSSGAKTLQISQDSTSGALLRVTSSNTDGVVGAFNNAMQIATIGEDPMQFYTNSTEKMRIKSNGNVGIGDSATDPNFKLQVRSDNTGSEGVTDLRSNSSSFTGNVLLVGSNTSTTNSTYNHMRADAHGVSQRFAIRDSGNVVNANNQYGSLSDKRLKENIVDANSQWNDIKALKIRRYNRIGEEQKEIGVIAQELEASNMSGLVEDGPYYDVKNNPDEETRKTVKYSILYMKAVKALQEAMTRIETLEAKVTALENAE